MSGFWRIFLIVCVSVIVIAVGFWGYSYYQKIKNPTSPALHAISPNTFLFAEIKNLPQSFNKLTSKTELWKEIIHISALSYVHKELVFFDSVFKTDSYINEIYEQYKLVITLNDNHGGEVTPVYIFELPATEQGLAIESFIKKINGAKSIVMKKSYEKTELMMVNISSLERIFNYTIHNGLFVGSFDERVLKEVVDHLNSGEPVNTNERFRRIEQTAGKNVDANIYQFLMLFETRLFQLF